MKRFSVVVLIINAALLGFVAQQLPAQDVVDPGGGVIVGPGGVLPGRGPSFTLGFRGDDILIPRPGQPQANPVFCTLTTAGLADDQPGAQGWSFGVQPRGGCRIGGYFTQRTASGSAGAGGRVQSVGFERTELINDGEGILQGVVLSFTAPITLSPGNSPHDLLGLFVVADVPEGEACESCTLTYVDGLQGIGQPVQVVATWNGATYRPARESKVIQICPSTNCFEEGETGEWSFSSSPGASGSARVNKAGGFELCGHGRGYGRTTYTGEPVDGLNVIGQVVEGDNDFIASVRVTRIAGVGGYCGLEVRPRGINSITGFDASQNVLALGVRFGRGNQLSVEAYARGFSLLEEPASVGIENLPVDLRFERRDGILVGSYSNRQGQDVEFLRTADAGNINGLGMHFNPNRALYVGVAQGSSGVVEDGLLVTSSVYFDDPQVVVDYPPPPPPVPAIAIDPVVSGRIELVGEDIESIVGVTVAGLEAEIVSKEDGKAILLLPEADVPVRGDIVIRRDGVSSVIRNAFFSYGGGFIRGDCNDDGGVDVSDAIKIFGYLFLGDSTCDCRQATDSNGDRAEDISDGIYLLAFLFSGGPPPPAPFPEKGFSEDSDSSEICGLEEHLPVITNITVVDGEGNAAGNRPLRLQEGSRLQIDGRNFEGEPLRNNVVAGDARLIVLDASPTQLLVEVTKVPTQRVVEIGIIRDFFPFGEQQSCFDNDCPPAVLGPLVKFEGQFELLAGNVEALGASFANENANGLVLQLDRALFSPNANLGAREVSIEALLEVPVVRRASAGARRVSVTEIFSEGTSGAQGVRRLADSLRRELSGGGRLSEISVIEDFERARILIEPTVDVLDVLRDSRGGGAGLPFVSLLRGVISVYDTPFGRCGPNNLHPIDDERAFGWCRFEELVEPCDGLPAFEWFFTHEETFSPSEVPENVDPDDRSPESKEVMYNLSAYCHIRDHRLWCRADLDDLIADGETDIPPFPRAAWVLKCSWVHESITTSGLAGAGTNMNDAALAFGWTTPAEIQAFKDQFYSYDYTGNDPHDTTGTWPAGRYYLRALHHTTKDIDEWFWYDAYIWGTGPLDFATANQEPKIGGCGGSSEDAPASVANDPTWGEYRLCTNVTDAQRDPGPDQEPEPTGADVGPQANGDPSAWCGNFLISVECPDGSPFFGTATPADTCLNCHERMGEHLGLKTDFLASIPFRSIASCISGSSTPVTFSGVIEPELDNTCGGCHNGSGGSLPGSMDLTTGNAYSSLVGILSQQAPPMRRVEPNLSAQSYFLHKINGTHGSVGGSGTQMPPASSFSSQLRQDIEDWINSGAPNN